MPTADELLGPGVLARLIDVLEGVRPGHPLSALRECRAALASGAQPPLALRQRSDLLAEALLADFAGTASDLDSAIRAAMADPRFTGWMIWPVTEAISARALESRPALGAPGGAGAEATTVRPRRTRAEATADGPSGKGADTAADRDFDAALELLAALTARLTAEFAIRPLLQADLARALPIVQRWVTNPDPHVRRLASEGTRAFLPWAKRVPALLAEPRATLPIIDALYRDESDYVRRSVANHLNDLSRQNPDLAAAIAAKWMLAPDDNTARVVRHGLRSLVKKGHGPTLALFGFDAQHGVTVVGPVLGAPGGGTGPVGGGHAGSRGTGSGGTGSGSTGSGSTGSGGTGSSGTESSDETSGRASVAIGGELPFTITLENTTDQPATLVIDYIVHHRKANATQTAKVFKLATTTLAPGERAVYARRHSFKRITTRVYHPGEHALEVQVNGVASGRVPFLLVDD